MKKLLLISSLFLSVSNIAQAECYGTDIFSTCYDNNGNTYDVTRYGNTTEVSGYNSRTGSRWSQESTTYGNTTEMTGKDKNGNSWNQTITDYGTFIDYDGKDSQGNRFNKTCWKMPDGSLDCN